jgi:tRNA threonylcarbamoyladenosine biosynthesis protein TsaE
MTGSRQVTVDTAAGMRALGKRLAGLLQAGDLVILSGALGAGKTTLVQGIGEGLGVRGPVTSPTFVIARVHPSVSGGPDLVHADAYRLASPAEVDDLDLDEAMGSSVTVVEWGGGLAEGLAEDRLEVTITPAGDAAGPPGDAAGPTGAVAETADERRTVCFAGHGGRWHAVGDSAFLALSCTPEAL